MECCLGSPLPNKHVFPKPEERQGLGLQRTWLLPWDMAWDLGAHFPGNETPSHVGQAPQQLRACWLPPHTPGGDVSGIPILSMRDQAKTGYMTCNLTGLSQVPIRPA